MKNLTKVSDLCEPDVERLLESAFRFKELHDKGIRREKILDGLVIAMIFEKPSLRTKVAFEVAASFLGAVPIFLSSSQILASGQNEVGRESIPDIGRNLERFCDLIIARVYSHRTIEELSGIVRCPLINALCDRHHPTQALADLMAIRMHKQMQDSLKVAFIGDGNNVATSLMQICALSGLNFSIASPEGFEIPPVEREIAFNFAKNYRTNVEFLRSAQDAVNDADVVYTDTFVSMGQEGEKTKRREAFQGYQVNETLMSKAKPDAVFMHCLPAHRGEEVTDEVMDSKQSIVFDQAECRLHIAKALLCMMLDSRH
ncbi:MAG: ornithine carbamoyltransferase [SAR324 cluster bacterium]|uniref:Ornithine carbamoyltransferase n=1 Tax=SAR324 cluster bacterium TaxID=2024889 RepID=A0A7X9FTX5_9DELT|nr:ornithine carbamoyltransferase [SAR324 cluster bacterium]